MTGLNHAWGGDPDKHADFVHGGVPIEDFDEEFPVRHRKKAKRGKRKVCKKSKAGESCDFTVVVTDHLWYDVVTCSRCGKHGEYIWKHQDGTGR